MNISLEISLIIAIQAAVLIAWMISCYVYQRNVKRFNQDHLREIVAANRNFLAEIARLRIAALEDLETMLKLKQELEKQNAKDE